MKNKQTREQDEIERAKLKLAFLKRHPDYQASFKKLKRNFQTEDGLLSTDCEKILFGEMDFNTLAAPYIDRAVRDGVLFEILDPEKDIDGTHADTLLYFMFYVEGIKEIKRLDLRVNYEKMVGRTPENHLIDTKSLKDYERLLIVDLRKPKWSLVSEFMGLIDNTYVFRKMAPNISDFIKNRPKELAREWAAFIKRVFISFESWEPDNSRSRKEEWMQIKVWDLYGTELPQQKETSHPWGFSNHDRKRKRKKRNFKHVAYQLNITVDAARQAYRKAFERIYHEPYNLEAMRKMLQSEAGPCKNCPNFDSCTEPCPKLLAILDQENTKRKERRFSEIKIPEDSEDPAGWLNEKNRK